VLPEERKGPVDFVQGAIFIFVAVIVAGAYTARFLLTRSVRRKLGGREAYNNLYYPDQSAPGSGQHGQHGQHGGFLGGGGFGGHGGGHHGGGGGDGGGGHHH
jgi:hypothetical protein